MNVRRFCRFLLAYGIALVCFGSAVFGQSEKITLRQAPTPNQTVKMRMVQDIQMEISMSGAAALPGMQGMKMGTKSVSSMTQKVGPANAQGITESEVTFDESSVETTVNGQPMPTPGTTSNATGTKFVVVIDKEGKTVDIKGAADI